MERLYLVLCIAGSAIPLALFMPWLVSHGPDLPNLLETLFANPVSAFFGADVIISALALLTLIVSEGKSLGMKWRWLPIVATFCIGVSSGLPLYLYLREKTKRTGRAMSGHPTPTER